MTAGVAANLTSTTWGAEQVTGAVAVSPAEDAEILEIPDVLQVRRPWLANGATAATLLAQVADEVMSAVLPSA